MRFVGADGKDVLPRKDRVWSTGGVLGRMRDALKAAERDVPGWLDVVALVRRVVDSAAPGVLRRGLELSFDAEVESAWIEADEVLFAEAIDNLIDNALQHGGPDMTRIQVSVACSGPETCIAVCDDGKGIAEKDRNRALARFVQIGPSRGSGLGVPICASVVRAAQGRIELGAADPGLCVRLYLPVSTL